jgi:hypothetical protein
MAPRDAVKFYGEVKVGTPNAYLIYDGKNEVWIPRSQIMGMEQVGRNTNDYEIKIPEWLAKAKGII